MTENAYQVLSIARRVDSDLLGNIYEVYRIDFRTRKGLTGVIRVPVGATKEEIRQRIEAEAEKLDSII